MLTPSAEEFALLTKKCGIHTGLTFRGPFAAYSTRRA
jgi:hypothetical protein